MNDRDYMLRAIELAKKGIGWTAPNPMVGAVIVKDGRIIGEGYHRKCGELHGRTPPCTQAIIENKIARVFIGSRDPNPLVSGKGAALLREHGIEVFEDFLREECDEINPVFFKYITSKNPYVVLKYAMSLDGKIAAHTGKSKWITGETARRHVHNLRGYYSAVLAGIGTVIADDPMLNCRLENSHQPLRVIVDTNLRIPLDSKICKTANEFPTLIACVNAAGGKKKAIENLGADVIVLPEKDGHVCLKSLMNHLGKMQISSVLIEGGGDINESALRADIVNHIYAYIAPKIIGGKSAKTPVEGLGAESPDMGATLKNPKITQLGEDILIEYDVERGVL